VARVQMQVVSCPVYPTPLNATGAPFLLCVDPLPASCGDEETQTVYIYREEKTKETAPLDGIWESRGCEVGQPRSCRKPSSVGCGGMAWEWEGHHSESEPELLRWREGLRGTDRRGTWVEREERWLLRWKKVYLYA
jgi:hypothetical protein